MRILGLVVALLVTLSVSAAAQTAGRSRSSPDASHSNSYGYSGTKADTSQAPNGSPDPYLQRYYSHSEGWTYYNFPTDSSARRPDAQ
jgi:hypothetical protein